MLARSKPTFVLSSDIFVRQPTTISEDMPTVNLGKGSKMWTISFLPFFSENGDERERFGLVSISEIQLFSRLRTRLLDQTPSDVASLQNVS